MNLETRLTITFAIKSQDYIYAIGGRAIGEDSFALIKQCERYSLVKQEWEPIADLN